MNKRRELAFLWLVVLLVLLGGFLWQVQSGLDLKTDMLELFPSSSEHEILRIVTDMMEGKTAGKVLFLLSDSGEGSEPSLSEKTREAFVEDLRSSSVFETVVSPADRATRRAYYEFYFPHRYKLLTPELRKTLTETAPVSSLTEDVRRYLYGSTAPFVSELIDQDPLLLFPRLMTYWQDKIGRNSGRDGSGRMIIAQLSGDPYAVQFQRQFKNRMEALRMKYQDRTDHFTLEWTGVIRFASTIRERMRQDLRTIGMLSTTAVVLLILLVFWSLRHLFVLVGTLAVSILSAVAVLFWVWPEPHIFTIVFSTSLIGVSVDYAFHFFTEHRYAEHATGTGEVLRRILPGITIGMITTVIGYVGLTLTPLPILKQMALFSSAGIVVAFGTVACWYPYLFGSSAGSRRVAGFDILSKWLLRSWEILLASRYRILVVGLLVVGLLGSGLSQLSFNDDVRYFENVPEGLVETDRRIRKETGQWNTGRFVLVEASDQQTLLERLEKLEPTLEAFVEEGTIGDFRSLTPFVPSRTRQRENFTSLSETLLPRKRKLRDQLTGLGIPGRNVEALVSDLEAGPSSYITPERWRKSRVSFGLRTLWLGEAKGTYNSIVLLRDIDSESTLRHQFADSPNVHYRNRLRSFNRLFESYREEAMVVAALAYVVIVLLLGWRYGPLGGTITAAPSVVGGLLTVALLSLLGWSFNVTHVLALLLVLGIGIDYAVFLRESMLRNREVSGTMVAIVLSALSTIFSFGFLGLSRAKMLSSIGATVFVGIVVVLVLAPFVQLDVSYDPSD